MLEESFLLEEFPDRGRLNLRLANSIGMFFIRFLNAYVMEDPLTALKEKGLISLLEADPNTYSFVFDAMAGALDHVLATPSLAEQVQEAIEWHINADEPQLLDYNLEHGRDANLFDGSSPYRASDHDPIIIGLDLIN